MIITDLRYSQGGSVAHITEDSPGGVRRALCHGGPIWDDQWCGTRSRAEYDRLRVMSICANCSNVNEIVEASPLMAALREHVRQQSGTATKQAGVRRWGSVPR